MPLDRKKLKYYNKSINKRRNTVMTKRVVSFLLSAILALSCLSVLGVSSFAASAVTLSADKTKASIGEIVTVSYKVPAGIDSYVGGLQVNKDYFTVVEAKAANHAGMAQVAVTDRADNLKVIGFAGMKLATKANETLFTVKLQVKKMGGTLAARTKEAYDASDKALSVEGVNLVIKPGDKNINFPDVKEGSWYYNAVEYCAVKGFVFGYSNGYFGPADSLKRQDFVCILARIAGADLSKYEGKASKLKDVKTGAYYASAVNWAVDNNIIAGYQNGNFGVGDNITREQVCTILYRYKGAPEVTEGDTLAKFTDKAMVSSFAHDAVVWAVQNGVISGMADGRVAPREGASRAQIAVIIMNMDKNGMFTD